MEGEVKYCTNCKRDISSNNYVIHTAHCERKIQLCDRCSEPVPLSELEKHEEEFHSKDYCTECGVSVEKWQIEKHKETCTKKLIPCEYCELEVPLDKLHEHTAACGSRTEQCFQCNKHVMIKDLKKHPANCSRRKRETVPCEHCDLPVDWDDIIEHNAICGTRTERCFLCNEHVMVKDRDTHFVTCGKALNHNEQISCDFCGGSFSNDSIKRHVELCLSQLVKCFRCNVYIQGKDMGLHLAMCEQKEHLIKLPCQYCKELFPDTFLKDHSDVCEYRKEKCAICDKYIPFKDLEMHSIACEEKRQSRLNKGLNSCKYCGKIFPSSLIEDHCKICAPRNPKCENCGKYIPLKNMEVHLSECKEKRRLKRDIPCKYCGELFLSDSLEDHVDKCGSKTKNCEKCDKYIELKNMETHSNMCKENLSNTYGICSICHHSIPWMEMNVHSAYCKVISDTNEYERQNQFNELALRKESDALRNKVTNGKKSQEETIRCPFCFEIFQCSLFSQHLQNCQERPYSCSECLKPMPHRLKEDHEHRCVGQRRKTHADDSIFHDEETYENKELRKFKKCQYCDKKLPDVLLQHHLKECEHREEKCQLCFQNVPVKDMQCHKSLKCNSSLSEQSKNPNNDNTYSKDLAESSKSFETLSQLEENVDICPSCECKIPEERSSSHMLLCFKNKTRCNFCWKEIPKKDEHLHLQTCSKILEIVKEEKKKEKKNKGKSFSEKVGGLINFWTPNKEKSYERNSSGENYQGHSSHFNRGQSYERGNMAPIHPLTSNLNEVNELPCEFCNLMWPSELLIEHESGCRPDLVSFPQNDEGKDYQKFATAAAIVTQNSSSPVLGAASKNIREEGNEWKIQSKRSNQASNTENIDWRIKERNIPLKQLNVKEKFFFYPSQDTDPKKQSTNCRKKRYPQVTESQETAKLKSDKEMGSKRDEFFSFKFSTSRFSEELQNRKENDSISSTDLNYYDETKKSNSDDRSLSSESRPVLNYPTSIFNREIKAVGAERTERKRGMHSNKDVDVDLSLAQKGFEEMSLKKPIKCDENSKNEPSKFLETIESRRFNLIMPTIWNAECSSNNDKTFKSHFTKSFHNNYDDGAKDILSNASENIESRVLNSSMQNTDNDVKNKETFAKSFVESIRDYNQNELEENDTRSERSNSDDTFYDADDGGGNCFDTVNDNLHGSNNTQEITLNRYDFDNLNINSKNQKENAKPGFHDDTSVDNRLEEEDFDLKDCDLDGYFEFLLKSVESSDELDRKMLNEVGNSSYKTPKDCKCGNRECCCEPSSSIEKISLQACSLREELSSKISEFMDIEPIVAGSKTSDQIKSKKRIELSKNKIVEDKSVNEEALKWKEWRAPREKIVFSSDSE